MIDRLRRDDQENGVGGVYHPPEGEGEQQAEEEEEEEENMDEDVGAGKRGKGKGRSKVKRGKKDEKVGTGGEHDQKTHGSSRISEVSEPPRQAPLEVRIPLKRRRANPFMGDADAVIRAIKRRAKEG